MKRLSLRSLAGLGAGVCWLLAGPPAVQAVAGQAGAPTTQQPAGPPVPAPKAPAVPPTTQAGPQPPAPGQAGAARQPPTTPDAAVPPGYVIGPDDVLTVLYRVEKDMSSEVVVRPDGMISLPLLNEVQAGGLTPDQLRLSVIKGSMKFLVEEPTVSVIVKTINSRKVYITGAVAKSAYYSLSGPTTVVQLIAMAGGLQEFADAKHIMIVRNDSGRPVSYPFNYKDFVRGKNLKQNIELRPGDTVIVP